MSMDRQQLLKQLDKAWVALKASCAGLSDSQLKDRRPGWLVGERPPCARDHVGGGGVKEWWPQSGR